MLTLSGLTITFGDRTLFKEVQLKFTPGSCYGLIGPNGAGKSTLLKTIAGQREASAGSINTARDERIALLQQDQFAFDAYTVLDTVIMGHTELYAVMSEREVLYAKASIDEADGIRSGELEAAMAEMDGYSAETEAVQLLSHLGIGEDLLYMQMAEVEPSRKVRILLAQALFGSPDILLLDEPTNQLDLASIAWLEDFLLRFQNTVIVVSHDRHFLNNVCTHIADIDFQKIRLYVGNYDFWHQASQLAQRQQQSDAKQRSDRIEELERFVRRFSANASKSKQATSRKNLIEKLKVDELPSSSRRFPFVGFNPERPVGNVVLQADDLSASEDGEVLLADLGLQAYPGDKIAFIGPDDRVKTVLFDILTGTSEPDSGSLRWGTTITTAYFPKENASFFESDMNLIDWLRQYSTDNSETFVRGFLGRMLFSGDEALKTTQVLSGGEKVRCMLARMMLSNANVLLLDEPTNHLDLEAITALNDGLIRFPGVVLFSSHDYQFVDTIANRIIEIAPGGVIDRPGGLDAYHNDSRVQDMRRAFYGRDKAMRV
jgi:ATPase subunit of ABC transporter with duplicated ATPase domains